MNYYTKDNYDFSKHSDPEEKVFLLAILKIILCLIGLYVIYLFDKYEVENGINYVLIGLPITLLIADLIKCYSFKSNILSTAIAAALAALIIIILTLIGTAITGSDLMEDEYRMPGLPLLSFILFYLIFFVPIMIEGAIADSIVFLITKIRKKQH